MQPTLAVLHEQPPTWAGLLSQRAFTGVLSIVTFGLSAASKPTTIFRVELLPHDSFGLLVPPAPLSGVLVLSSNAISFVDDGRVHCSLGVNGYAPTTVHQPLQPPEVSPSRPFVMPLLRSLTHVLVQASGLEEAMVLTGGRGAALSGDAFLLGVGTGEMVLLRLIWGGGQRQAGGGQRVVGMSMKKLGGGQGAGVFTTAVAAARSAGLVLVASRTVDSLLMTYELGKEGEGDEDMDVEEDEDGGALQDGETDEEDLFLYGRQAKGKRGGKQGGEGDGSEGLRFAMEIVDSFTSLGPLASGALGPRLPKEYYDAQVREGRVGGREGL